MEDVYLKRRFLGESAAGLSEEESCEPDEEKRRDGGIMVILMKTPSLILYGEIRPDNRRKRKGKKQERQRDWTHRSVVHCFRSGDNKIGLAIRDRGRDLET